VEEVAPCKRCGEATDHRVELTGAMSLTMAMCERCADEKFTDIRSVSHTFDSLLKCGVDRAMANRIMVQQITGMPS
jgi:hypothetical protein